jgi:hypothetical protein
VWPSSAANDDDLIKSRGKKISFFYAAALKYLKPRRKIITIMYNARGIPCVESPATPGASVASAAQLRKLPIP